MRASASRLLVLCACVLAAIWGTYAIMYSGQSPPPALLVSNSDMRLGDMWETGHKAHSVDFENTGTQDINIESFSMTCDCVGATPQSLTIRPGERQLVHFQINTGKYIKDKENLSLRITPLMRDAASGKTRASETIIVSGRIRRAIECDKETFVGCYSWLLQSHAEGMITVNVTQPLRSLDVASAATNSIFRLDSSGIKLDGGRSSLPLRLAVKLEEGEYSEDIVFRPVLANGTEVPELKVKCKLSISSDIQSEPNVIQVGGRRIGEKFDGWVKLASVSGQEFTVLDTSVSGDGLSITKRGSSQYYIDQKVTTVGHQNNFVIFKVRQAERQWDIKVPVIYTGIRTN